MDIEDVTELKEVNKNSQKSEETPTMKVIIKEFARQNIKEKEISKTVGDVLASI